MKKVIFIISLIFFMICTTCSYAYSDVDEGHWAYDTINDLSKKDVLSGYPDGSFRPENNITRAEFITILMRAIESNADVTNTLGFWAEKSIKLAEDKKILRLSEYSEFDPNKAITRREICLMLCRSIEGLDNISIDKLSNKKQFYDININNTEEMRITAILSHFGILNGYLDNTVRLDGLSSRAELCAFVNNFMKSRCILLSAVNDEEHILYENDIGIVNLLELPKELKKHKDLPDIPYLTTEVKEIAIFPFNSPPDCYNNLFEQIKNAGNKYLEYRKKFGENNYVIAVSFDTTNNTYEDELYAGYEFFRISFPEEKVNIVDAFDTDEIFRQSEGNANIGEIIAPGETHSTSAFYVVDLEPKSKIRFDRDLTGIYNLDSFHSLIVNLEGR